MEKKLYHYKECGLDNVFLQNGVTAEEGGNVFIHNIHGLHEAIANQIVLSPDKLKAKEIRFLRHYLDWSQKCLGEQLRVDYQTVMRWESGKIRIPGTAERLLRGLVYEYLNGDKRMTDLIERISDIDNEREESEFTFKKGEWKAA